MNFADIKRSSACLLHLGVKQVEAVVRHQIHSGDDGHASQGDNRAAVGVSLLNNFLPGGQQEYK